MKNAVILYFALMMSVGAASASGIEQMLISDLAAEGFTRVEVKRGVTQLKVDAIRGDQKLVLVIDTTTGKILKKHVGQVWLFDNAAPGFFISDRGRNFTGKPAGTGSIDRDTASSALSPTAPHAAPEAAAVVAAADAALLPARHEPADATMIRMADPLLGWDEGQDVGDYFPDVGEVVLGIAIGEPNGDYGDGTDQTADEWVDDGSDPADDEAVEDGLVAGGDEGADDGSEAGRDGAADDQMITIDDGLVVVPPATRSS